MKSSTTPSPAVSPLRAVREARGLSIREIAAQAGIDPAHLSRVERGQRTLSVGALHRMARVLGLKELAKTIDPYRTKP